MRLLLRLLLSALLGILTAVIVAFVVAVSVLSYFDGQTGPNGLGIVLIIACVIAGPVGVVSGVSIAVWAAKP